MHLLRFLPLAAAITAVAAHREPKRPEPYTGVVIFEPPRNYTIPRTLYARNEQLPDGDILATWENYSPEPPAVYFPIYRSSDHGETWTEISRVHDTANGLGLRYQPFLYHLPERVGRFRAGTLLLAGSSIPTDLSSTQIDLYASQDKGLTWKFLSHIAAGGEAIPNNGLTPVWEPFLLAHKGKLIAYYADQRDNATHGQKLSHQVSDDLINWGPPVDDVAYPTYTDRPGMPVVTKLPNGKYFYIYEYGSFFNSSDYSFPLYYRISADPEGFIDAEHHELAVSSGTIPTSSPYVVWTPWGGKNGTIVVSAGTQEAIFVNQELGEGEWTEVPTPASRSYTRSVRILKEDPRFVLLHGGGVLLGEQNKVTVTLLNLEDALAAL